MIWRVEHATGAAAAIHARPLTGERFVSVWDVDRPALVLGSAQRDDVVDLAACAAAGVEVVHRRSGGGAVLVEPGGVVWVDVELPRGDALWDDDVGRATWWLGEAWRAALALPGATVNHGGLIRGPWSDLVCFAGLGPGEVTVGGAKVVGISQRRTREGARFQCAVPRAWDAARLVSLLALDDAARADAVVALSDVVRVVDSAPDGVVHSLVASLPV